MSRILTKIWSETTIYIIILVVSLAALIVLESWPGARVMMLKVDKSLGIVSLYWPLLLVGLIAGFLLSSIIIRKE